MDETASYDELDDARAGSDINDDSEPVDENVASFPSTMTESERLRSYGDPSARELNAGEDLSIQWGEPVWQTGQPWPDFLPNTIDMQLSKRDTSNACHKMHASLPRALSFPPLPLRVAIVGAGVSGLVSAHQLASRGFHVTIIEARSRIGGRILTWQIPDDDSGPAAASSPADESPAAAQAEKQNAAELEKNKDRSKRRESSSDRRTLLPPLLLHLQLLLPQPLPLPRSLPIDPLRPSPIESSGKRRHELLLPPLLSLSLHPMVLLLLPLLAETEAETDAGEEAAAAALLLLFPCSIIISGCAGLCLRNS